MLNESVASLELILGDEKYILLLQDRNVFMTDLKLNELYRKKGTVAQLINGNFITIQE